MHSQSTEGFQRKPGASDAGPKPPIIGYASVNNHTPLAGAAACCDFLVAGVHKWLRAYQPMGLGFCCRASSEGFIRTICRETLGRWELDDPLLRFTGEVERGSPKPYSETVNLSPLFTATAAAAQMKRSPLPRRDDLARQLDNSTDWPIGPPAPAGVLSGPTRRFGPVFCSWNRPPPTLLGPV